MPDTILFLDLETTGLDLAAAHIVEFAAMRYGWPLGDERPGLNLRLIDPGVPIPPEASAVHHLVDADVEGCMTESQLGELLSALPVPGVGGSAICGHNISLYDLPIARARLGWPPAGVPVLDTDRLARHVWPDLPSYKLEVLAYRFGLHPSDQFASLVARPRTCRSIGAHSAGYDCLMCVNLLRRIAAESGVDTLSGLAELSASPILVKKMRFGKHAGQLIADLPRDYIAWLLRQPWLQAEQPDLAYTLGLLAR